MAAEGGRVIEDSEPTHEAAAPPGPTPIEAERARRQQADRDALAAQWRRACCASG